MQLSPYGITPNYCLKIYKKYKENAISIINKNPYRLAEDIRGIGFRIADDIAKKLGIDKYSRDRIFQGILYTLNQSASNGNTYLPLSVLVPQAMKVLEIEAENIKEGVLELAYTQKIHVEKDKNDINV